MATRPVDSAALGAAAETLGMRLDVRRHPAGDRAPIRLDEHAVALRATREEELWSAADPEPGTKLGDLPRQILGADQEHARTGRGRHGPVAGQQPASLRPRLRPEGGSADARAVARVEPGETQPTGERTEHHVAHEPGLVHRSILCLLGRAVRVRRWRRCASIPLDALHPSQLREVFMTAGGTLRDRLAQTDPEYQELLAEHRARDVRLDELKAKGWLSTEEEQEEKRLKKEKLRLKDRMEALLRERAT